MTSPFFLFSADTQFSNIGDALINRELLKLLRARGQILATRGSASDEFLNEIDLRKCEIVGSSKIELLLAALRKRLSGHAVFLILTPGDMVGHQSIIKSIARTVSFALAASLGLKILQVGVSLSNQPKMELTLFAIRTIFMTSIGIRDPMSMKYAKESGFRKAHYFPDLAFGIPPKSRNAEIKSTLSIAISFRDDHLLPNQKTAIAASLKLALSRLEGSPKVHITVQVKKDVEFAEMLAEELKPWTPEIYENLSIDGFSQVYEKCDIIISNRLHALLLGGINGALPIPFIDKKSNTKILGLFEGLGLKDLVCLYEQDLFIPNSNRIRDLSNTFYQSALNEHRLLKKAFDKSISYVHD